MEQFGQLVEMLLLEGGDFPIGLRHALFDPVGLVLKKACGRTCFLGPIFEVFLQEERGERECAEAEPLALGSSLGTRAAKRPSAIAHSDDLERDQRDDISQVI